HAQGALASLKIQFALPLSVCSPTRQPAGNAAASAADTRPGGIRIMTAEPAWRVPSDGPIDEAARRPFEAARRAGTPEPVEHCLPAPEQPHYLATLVALVHIELEFAWKAWRAADTRAEATACDPPTVRPPLLEAYLARFAALDQPAILRRLIAQEYRV